MTNAELLQTQKMMGMPPVGNIAQPVHMQGYHQSTLPSDNGQNISAPIQNVPNSEMTPAQVFQQQEMFQNTHMENALPMQTPLQRMQDFVRPPEVPQNPSASPVNEYMQEIANLRASQERMMQMMGSLSFQNPQQIQEQVVPPPPPPDFLKNVDMDNVLSSKEQFNNLLVNVYNQALADAERTITPRVSEIAQEQVSRKMETRQALDAFYARNPEYANKKELIAMSVKHIRQRNMDIQDPNEILSKVEQFLGVVPKSVNSVGTPQNYPINVPQNSYNPNVNPAFVQSLNNGGSFNSPNMEDSQRSVIDSFVNYHLQNSGRA